MTWDFLNQLAGELHLWLMLLCFQAQARAAPPFRAMGRIGAP